MGWTIRIGEVGFERSMNAGVITSTNCSITSTPCHTIAHLCFSVNTSKTPLNKAASIPAWQAERVWRDVLSAMVEI